MEKLNYTSNAGTSGRSGRTIIASGSASAGNSGFIYLQSVILSMDNLNIAISDTSLSIGMAGGDVITTAGGSKWATGSLYI